MNREKLENMMTNIWGEQFAKEKADLIMRRHGMLDEDHQTEKLEANIIENGRCIICGKPLEGNRLFVCDDCSEKMETEK